MKKLVILLSIFALLCALPASAQSYKGAVGLRLGYPGSVSLKYFTSERLAVEGIVGTRGYSNYRWLNAGIALLYHTPLEIDDVEGLSFYYGAGVNTYFWSYKKNFINDNEPNVTLGIAGYLGLDFDCGEEIPLNITLDWSPTLFINGQLGGFGGAYGGVGVRYIFSRAE
jgi:hypothetical protein